MERVDTHRNTQRKRCASILSTTHERGPQHCDLRPCRVVPAEQVHANKDSLQERWNTHHSAQAGAR